VTAAAAYDPAQWGRRKAGGGDAGDGEHRQRGCAIGGGQGFDPAFGDGAHEIEPVQRPRAGLREVRKLQEAGDDRGVRLAGAGHGGVPVERHAGMA
jgi:hypothetical protein